MQVQELRLPLCINYGLILLRIFDTDLTKRTSASAASQQIEGPYRYLSSTLSTWVDENGGKDPITYIVSHRQYIENGSAEMMCFKYDHETDRLSHVYSRKYSFPGRNPHALAIGKDGMVYDIVRNEEDSNNIHSSLYSVLHPWP